MKEFVEKIANVKHGLTSILAQQCLDKKELWRFVDYFGQQAVKDAPESIRRNFGDELYEEGVRLYNELPEELKTYTTGK